MVNVDTVYQRVLALANKEQRGYITPQEYNLLANQAQMQIFESYFYMKGIRDRLEPLPNPEQDETNVSEIMGKKLAPFQTVQEVTGGTMFPATAGGGTVYHTGRVFLNGQVCHKVSINEANRLTRSVRHISTAFNQGPIYSDGFVSGEDIAVYSGSANQIFGGITVECFRVPATINWTYVVVNGKALYNASDTSGQNFELHLSEEDTLVYKILDLAGIVMNKPGLSQLVAMKETGEQTIQTQ